MYTQIERPQALDRWAGGVEWHLQRLFDPFRRPVQRLRAPSLRVPGTGHLRPQPLHVNRRSAGCAHAAASRAGSLLLAKVDVLVAEPRLMGDRSKSDA